MGKETIVSDDFVTSILAKVDTFPPLPSLVTRVIALTSDPESSAEDLMKVIRPDPSVTITILKMANSAFFGLAREVSSIKQAVTVLGFKEIRNVVIATAVFNSFKGIKIYGMEARTFWEHSFLCGLAAQHIARGRFQGSSDYFVAGLIHDIGKLVVSRSIPFDHTNIMKTNGSAPYDYYKSELEQLGIGHDEVARRLLKRWMFPSTLRDAAGYHHRPDQLTDNPIPPLVVHIADLLAHAHVAVSAGDSDSPHHPDILFPPLIGVAKSCGWDLERADLDRFLEETGKSWETESSSLDLLFS